MPGLHSNQKVFRAALVDATDKNAGARSQVLSVPQSEEACGTVAYRVLYDWIHGESQHKEDTEAFLKQESRLLERKIPQTESLNEAVLTERLLVFVDAHNEWRAHFDNLRTKQDPDPWKRYISDDRLVEMVVNMLPDNDRWKLIKAQFAPGETADGKDFEAAVTHVHKMLMSFQPASVVCGLYQAENDEDKKHVTGAVHVPTTRKEGDARWQDESFTCKTPGCSSPHGHASPWTGCSQYAEWKKRVDEKQARKEGDQSSSAPTQQGGRGYTGGGRRGGRGRGGGKGRGKGKGRDDSCRACGQLGHWKNDPACPQFQASLNQGYVKQTNQGPGSQTPHSAGSGYGS
jgi:hypothetical protein